MRSMCLSLGEDFRGVRGNYLEIKQEHDDDDGMKVFATDCVSWICESMYLNISEEKLRKS